MSAGVPNWGKLLELGKLPKWARSKVPMLAQLDAAEKRIKELEAEVAELRVGLRASRDSNKNSVEGGVEVKCDVEGCDWKGCGKSEGLARNLLRMHGKAHASKK